ncbi:MAG: hypothetical protein QF454_00275 [Candidatus Thalassarchaeaceae archaeon]|jgi:hypothetical protein|nr:hypothetical protein [Candidatus Thalassarchaeaceae archaeon]
MHGWSKDCDACGKPIYIQHKDDGSTRVYSALESKGGKSKWKNWVKHSEAEPDCEYQYQHGGEA